MDVQLRQHGPLLQAQRVQVGGLVAAHLVGADEVAEPQRVVLRRGGGGGAAHGAHGRDALLDGGRRDEGLAGHAAALDLAEVYVPRLVHAATQAYTG
ncbi:hypothetical protein ON010_g13974 [Phytophthora cinnamomi]|nr:hypothetical protein ON010_g13974 [Phytophthora cinnamomi]